MFYRPETHRPEGRLPDWRMACVAIVLFLVPGGICRADDAPNATKTVVSAIKIVRGQVAQEASFEAELRPFQEIELHAKVTGYLETLTVDAGDQVKAGQLLATLDVPELKNDLEHAVAVERRCKAEIDRAQAAFDESHVSYTRLTAAEAAQPRLFAPQDLDIGKARDQSAQANLVAAREQASIAASDVKKYQTMLNYSQISSPFSGVISKRFADPGALIQAGTSSGTVPLVRLSQNDKLRISFPVSLSFVSLVKVGGPADVRIPSLGKTFPATISRFSRRVENSTRTMDVEVDLPNPDLLLTPGIYATVVLKLNQRDHVLFAPMEAVARDKKPPTVYLINKEGKIEERVVKIGMETPTRLEIVSGLEENDLVVFGGRAQIKPGQSVESKLIELSPSE
jgi:RND family efflux transporter MFP subunit